MSYSISWFVVIRAWTVDSAENLSIGASTYEYTKVNIEL